MQCRCGGEVEEGSEWAARGGLHADSTACPMAACDDLACQARKEPRTLEEWQVTCKHWQDHSYLSGCSHGC